MLRHEHEVILRALLLLERLGRNLQGGEGKSSEFRWGPHIKACKACGTNHLPEEFAFCGCCGEPLVSKPCE